MTTQDHDNTLRKIINKTETLDEARELLSTARVMTRQGSGRDLGQNVIALPAICALLASERLGNDDVSEKLAQQASCVNPKNFTYALAQVRAALDDTLRRRSTTRQTSFEAICSANYLANDDALYWMEEVEKAFWKTGELDDTDVRNEAVRCAIYRFVCKLLGLKCTGYQQLCSDYGIRAPEFNAVTRVLNEVCTEIQMSIEAFRKRTAAGAASATSTTSTQAAGPSSPSKSARPSTSTNNNHGEPTGSIAQQRLKRKASATFPLPFPFPEKKTKSSSVSPFKLNRVPVSTTAAAAAKAKSSSSSVMNTRAASMLSSPPKSPAKQLLLESVVTVPHTPVRKPLEDEEPQGSRASPRLSVPRNEESPAKIALDKMKSLALTSAERTEKSTPQKAAPKAIPSSPSKSPTKAAMSTPTKKKPTITAGEAGPSTTPSPTKKRGRPQTKKLKSPSPIPVDEDEDDEEEDEEEAPAPTVSSRHRRPPFLDRQFYTYCDPRVVREQELCDRHFEGLVKKFGFPNLRTE